MELSVAERGPDPGTTTWRVATAYGLWRAVFSRLDRPALEREVLRGDVDGFARAATRRLRVTTPRSCATTPRPTPLRLDGPVRGLQGEVREIVGREGVFVRCDHPELSSVAARLVRAGELVAVLPGVYAAAPQAQDLRTRVLALARREPDAVLVDRTAAQLSFWPELTGHEVACALTAPRPVRKGFRFVRRSVDPELVLEQGPLRMTVPALTALDLCAELGGDAIDHALRTRAATLDGMHRAMDLTRKRRGNGDRRAMLLDSRDEPWSAAERVCHRLLRGAGITGWSANHPVIAGGHLYYLDVAFPALGLVVEIDGRLHETDEDLFESDRWRQNALVLDGWMVLRFTWIMLRDHPAEVLEDVRAAMVQRRRQLAGGR